MRISLKISGKPVRKGGFIPIVSINDPDFTIKDAYTSTISSCEKYYTFSADTHSSVFKLVYNHIYTPGSAIPGQLVVGVAIPHGYKPENGIYRLLEEVFASFVADYTVAGDNGERIFNVRTINIDSLEQVLNDNPLVDDSEEYYKSDSNGVRAQISVDEQTIPAVLEKVPHCNALDCYSEVFIGEHINNAIITNQIYFSTIFPPDPVAEVPSISEPSSECNSVDSPTFIASASAINDEGSEAAGSHQLYADSTDTSDSLGYESENIGFAIPMVDGSEDKFSSSYAPTRSTEKKSKKSIIAAVLITTLIVGGIAYLLHKYFSPASDRPSITDTAPTSGIIAPDTVIVTNTVVIRDTVDIVSSSPAVSTPGLTPTAKVNEDEIAEPEQQIEPKFDPRAERDLNSLTATATMPDKDMILYNRCTEAINSPYKADKIIALRTEIAPFVDVDADFDRIDILLSRYAGGISLFKNIIAQINSDPTVKQFREKSRKVRTTGDERRNYINAIGNIVFNPGTKEFKSDIRNYILNIPYLSALLQPYLNSLGEYPTETPLQETLIMSM